MGEFACGFDFLCADGFVGKVAEQEVDAVGDVLVARRLVALCLSSCGPPRHGRAARMHDPLVKLRRDFGGHISFLVEAEKEGTGESDRNGWTGIILCWQKLRKPVIG